MQEIRKMDEGYSLGYMLRVGGIFTAIFSLIGGAIFTFAAPSSCGVVGGLVVVFFIGLLIASIIAFTLGLIIERRNNSATG